MASIRGTEDFVGHVVIPADCVDPSLGSSFQNIVIRSKSNRGKWIESLTLKIGDWRALFRSTYFHWALAINGLHVAADRYASKEWQSQNKGFTISGLQADKTGRMIPAQLALWEGDKAAKAHMGTVSKMSAWGFIELYAVFEDFVFDLYRGYLNCHPDQLLKGREFQELRQIRRAASEDASKQEAWEQALNHRIDGWQRKRMYDGLERVFLSLFTATGLKAPSTYQHTSPETWSESLRGIGLVRHSLIHGAKKVSQDIGEFCKLPHAVGLDFTEGSPLKIELQHLQSVELFSDQLLRAINLSLVEHADSGK